MQALDWLDWVVLTAYAAALPLIGWLASRGTKSADDHLRAGRSLPAWAVVFSILATEISAATYIGVPESAYNGDWTYLGTTLGALLGKIALGYGLIRLYWRLNLSTAYGFLGRRIGPRAQITSAWGFLAGRLIASGVRLFIAALAFAVVTDTDVSTAIVLMAALSTAYTWIGGLRAVVWTDVMQGSIFAIGALSALVYGLWAMGRPVGDVLAEAVDAGKLRALALTPDAGSDWLVTTRALPVAALGGFFLVLASHGTDQENVQHLLNVRSERSAGRSIISSGLIAFPIVAAFLAVGTMLWSYHRHVAVAGYDPADTRRIFPNFIMHVLPSGLRGLVFAGLFAAAISSLGATLNATATIWMNDVRPRPSGDSAGLARARRLNLVFGVLLALVGLFFEWFARAEETDLVQIALGAMTPVYGGLLGGFLCALLYSRRGSDASVTLAMVLSTGAGALLFLHDRLPGVDAKRIQWPWIIPIAVAIALSVGALGRRNSAVATT